jgi:hypothetical protein
MLTLRKQICLPAPFILIRLLAVRWIFGVYHYLLFLFCYSATTSPLFPLIAWSSYSALSEIGVFFCLLYSLLFLRLCFPSHSIPLLLACSLMQKSSTFLVLYLLVFVSLSHLCGALDCCMH